MRAARNKNKRPVLFQKANASGELPSPHRIMPRSVGQLNVHRDDTHDGLPTVHCLQISPDSPLTFTRLFCYVHFLLPAIRNVDIVVVREIR